MGKPLKITLIIIGSIALLTMVAALAGQALIKAEIRKALAKGPVSVDGVSYSIRTDKVRVSLPGRTVALKGVDLRSYGTGRDPVPSLRLRAERFEVRGISYRRGRDGQSAVLKVRAVELDSPHLEYEGIPGKVVTPEQGGEKVKDAAGGVVVQVGEVRVSGGSAYIRRWKDGYRLAYTLDGLDVTVEGFDTGAKGDGEKLLYCDRIGLSVGKFSYLYKRGALAMEVEGLAADSRENSLFVGSFRMTPQYGKWEYASLVYDNSDWTLLEFNNLTATDVDYRGIVADGAVSVGKVSFSDGRIESYKNRNIAADREKFFYYELIRRIGMPLTIPEIAVRNLDVRYDELAPGAEKPGLVTVIGMNGAIKGLTNRPAKPGQSFTADISAKFMGAGDMYAVWTMPVGTDHDNWELTGTLGQMDAAALNDLTAPLLNAKVVEGRIEGFDFHIAADSSTSTSSATILYDGLQVALLNKRDLSRERTLLSSIANDFVIKSSNPGPDGVVRSGEGGTERDHQRSQFNFIVKSLNGALKQIVM